MELDRVLVEKALTHLAIETALKDMGDKVYKQVGIRLYEKHRCYFSDCLEHPEYLSDVLHELFGRASNAIVDAIRINFEDSKDNRSITSFLVQLAK